MKTSSFPGTFKGVRFGIVTTLAVVIICSCVFQVLSNRAPVNRDASKGLKKSEKKYGRKNSCPRCAPPGDQEIYVPLIDLPAAHGGELVFNSRSPKSIQVTPKFYRLDGTTVIGDPVNIDPAEIRYVDIKTLIPGAHRSEREWGGLSLLYHGIPREMWAQFRFLRVNGGGNVDEFFTVKSEERSDTQQATWWTPSHGSVFIALGNVTDSPTSVVTRNRHRRNQKHEPGSACYSDTYFQEQKR